jgi:hypothetical protein
MATVVVVRFVWPAVCRQQWFGSVPRLRIGDAMRGALNTPADRKGHFPPQGWSLTAGVLSALTEGEGGADCHTESARPSGEAVTSPAPSVSALNVAAALPGGALRGSPSGHRFCDDRSDPTVAATLSASAVTLVSQEAAGVTPQAGALAFMVAPVRRGLL